MKPFELLLAYEVVEFLNGLPPRDEIALHGRLREIGEYPHNHSTTSLPGPGGRRYEVNLFRKFAVK